ncbi:MAG: hypothetical protein K8R59_10475 [Thermoanaerobaculales bacterium]|nr:hypothetical protein [Thermoanaerobaculales bacterium]
MKSCSFEERVSAAARTGSWSDELRDHCASCRDCAETTLVMAALVADAEMLAADTVPLPDPRAIWLRSRLQERRAKAVRATRVITWMQRLAIFLAGAVAASVVPGIFRHLFGPLRSFSPASLMSDMPLMISAPGVILLLTFGVMALMALWNEMVESG